MVSFVFAYTALHRGAWQEATIYDSGDGNLRGGTEEDAISPRSKRVSRQRVNTTSLVLASENSRILRIFDHGGIGRIRSEPSYLLSLGHIITRVANAQEHAKLAAAAMEDNFIRGPSELPLPAEKLGREREREGRR